MKYLEACIKEALRLYPSVPIIGRRLEQDTVIDGLAMPKGRCQFHKDFKASQAQKARTFLNKNIFQLKYETD